LDGEPDAGRELEDHGEDQVPMFPALRTSTTIAAVPKRRKKKRK
jgi:hypothetical protein